MDFHSLRRSYVTLIHRFLTDKRIELRARVAGCLVLLFPYLAAVPYRE